MKKFNLTLFVYDYIGREPEGNMLYEKSYGIRLPDTPHVGESISHGLYLHEVIVIHAVIYNANNDITDIYANVQENNLRGENNGI